ncbi:MAG: hypothetical protein QM736_15525, partial [Vicinamibacterales bacterium]
MCICSTRTLRTSSPPTRVAIRRSRAGRCSTIFDTYHDKQNGFIFGTNAAGIQDDVQVRNEGETLPSPTLRGRQQHRCR